MSPENVCVYLLYLNLLYLNLDKLGPFDEVYLEGPDAVELNFTYVVENLTPSNLKLCARAPHQDFEWKSLKNQVVG